MPLPMRVAGFWLVGCSLGVAIAFSARQYELLPDFFAASWLWHTIGLFVVVAAVAPLCLKPVVRSRSRATAVLLGGHLVAVASTYAFLTSRVHCVNISIAIDYWLPDEIGAFILLGPSLAVALASLTVGRPTWRCT
jgi:hypothetical protein